MVEHQGAESEGVRFDYAWGVRIFSLLHARDKTNFFAEFKFTISLILSWDHPFKQTQRPDHLATLPPPDAIATCSTRKVFNSIKPPFQAQTTC